MYDSRRLVIRTWSRFFMSTSGSIEARSDGWYICCMAEILQGAQGPWRPGPVDVGAGAGERASAAGLGRAEDEEAVGLRGAAGLAAPQLRHLADGRDIVESHAGESIALGLGGVLPDALGEPDAAPDPSTAIGLDVADHQHHHRVVRERRAQTGRDVAQEREVRPAVVGVVERRVDGLRVEAEEPRSEPVVIAVLHDPQVRR